MKINVDVSGFLPSSIYHHLTKFTNVMNSTTGQKAQSRVSLEKQI